VLEPVPRKASLGDAVFAQIRGQILRGALAAGAPLPSEHALCAAFGVSRVAVREALKRLEQVGLVAMQQGGRTRVRDYREAAGLELLPALLVAADGAVDPRVLRSLVEMRTALGVDAARLAAARGGPALADRLDAAVAALRAADGDLALLQTRTLAFWDLLVEGSENVAYRLAFNALRATTEQYREVLRGVLAEELRDVAGCAALAAAVRAQDPARAERCARALVARGARGFARATTRSRAARRRGGPRAPRGKRS